MDSDATFIIDKEQKYVHKYEERFDLPDPQYETWLKVNHPDHLRCTTKQHTSGGNTPTRKAHVLTSAECLKALQEKENEKKEQ